jgi:tetratricopeptide (TPR) repeat protein
MYRFNISVLSVYLILIAVLFVVGCQKETTAKEYYQKSFQFINAGSTQDAIELLTLAINKDPSFFEAYYNRGVMYYCQEKYQLALNDFDKAVSLNSNHAGAFAGRGTVYDKLNMPEKSLHDLRTAARLGDNETRDYLRANGIVW